MVYMVYNMYSIYERECVSVCKIYIHTMYRLCICILTPDYFPTLGYKTQFTDVDFNDGPLGDDAELCVKWRLGILLDTNEREVESCFKLRMSYMSFFEPEGLRT